MNKAKYAKRAKEEYDKMFKRLIEIILDIDNVKYYKAWVYNGPVSYGFRILNRGIAVHSFDSNEIMYLVGKAEYIMKQIEISEAK